MKVPNMFTSEFVVYYLSAKEVEFSDDEFNGAYKNRQKAFEEQKECAHEDHMLSFFVSAHDKGTKAFEKRTNTAKEWSEGSSWWKRVFTESKCSTVQNKPLSGFKLINTTRRYTTSNVLFRVLHPEGFIFEISSENAMDIIENCTIENGVIKDELFFDNSKYLLNTNLHKYKEHYNKAENAKKSQNLEFGDVCVLNICSDLTNYYNHEETVVQFLGKQHCFFIGELKSSVLNVFRDLKDNIFVCTDAKLKNQFREFSEMEFPELSDISSALNEINHSIKNGLIHDCDYKHNSQYTSKNLALVDSSKINITDIEYTYTKFDGSKDERNSKYDLIAVNSPNGMGLFGLHGSCSNHSVAVHLLDADVSKYNDTRSYRKKCVFINKGADELQETGMLFRIGLKRK